MPPKIDLHTHSSASDGTDSPAEVVAAAAVAGLDIVALTDHESADGWGAAGKAAADLGLGFVPGIELSTKLRGASIHMLGYLVDPTHPALAEQMREVRDARLIRARRMIEALSVDYDITVEDVDAQIHDGATVGRPHIADALVAKGIVPDRSTAFYDILHPRSPYYVSTFAPSPLAVVVTVRAAGGVPVLAHPATQGRYRVIEDDAIKELVDAGLFGLEIHHRDNTEDGKIRLYELAAKFGLQVTGASDYHGEGKPNRLGENTTSPEVLERLIAAGSGSRPFRG